MLLFEVSVLHCIGLFLTQQSRRGFSKIIDLRLNQRVKYPKTANKSFIMFLSPLCSLSLLLIVLTHICICPPFTHAGNMKYE